MLALLFLQVITQFSEHGWQLPVLEDRRVIQVGRLAAQHDEIMSRIKTIFVGGIASLVPSDGLISDHDLDVMDVGFHRGCLEGERAGHAVAVVVAGDRLVLVHRTRIADASIEATRGQRDRGSALLLKARADRFALPRGHPRQILLTTFAEVRVQLGHVAHLRNGRGPASLQILDAILHMRLLVAARRHAEQRIEIVMAGQGLIPRMQRPLPPRQNGRGHGGRIVPPQLARHAAKKLESLHHAVQDGFAPFGRQRDRKRTIRMCPGHQQHVHQTATVREVDVDVPKVGFGPLARSMVQREKRFPFADAVRADVAANLIIAARVSVLDKASKELCRRMTLLGRCRQVGL